MTNLSTVELTSMKAEDLRIISKSILMPGAWKAKKQDMISFIERHQLVAEAQELGLKVEDTDSNEDLSQMIVAEKQFSAAAEAMSNKPEQTEVEQPQASRKGRTRTINVFKDGELLTSVVGLMETFKYVTENKITNVGWVKRSLKTGEVTAAGYKYKVGGYKFEYAE